MTRLPLTSLLLPVVLLACGDSAPSDPTPSDTEGALTTDSSTTLDECETECSDDTGEPPAPTVDVSGDAFAFTLPGEPYGLIDGATISILENPAQTVTTDPLGHFELGSLPPGGTATFVLERNGFPTAHTKTFTLPQEGVLDQVTFQVPDDALFDLLAGLLMLEVDPTACQMVSTVTRVGKSIYDEGAHGEAGATVTVDPPLPSEHGPIYFNASVIPDPMLTETSEDGGVLLTNVPPGTYVLSAHKDGVTFESVTMQCESGVLVNASPPYGLQAL
ncbi:carboxypeptidase regulatory-like domain-containing protein [Paraliomyxa miuraensis]|uniref:carboxypeptidase regulatory-like domain-containing protein n=1 Tax=Paraliomyxa miuraensis TaxID=376150 RepID=UPI00224F9409|nr:carboxypeptidase regulatory-like domain-containing protein [Paraliomyxa miuraensis]MCX4246529.1 hypothetical protein [Paraliomyxa miuraensis]